MVENSAHIQQRIQQRKLSQIIAGVVILLIAGGVAVATQLVPMYHTYFDSRHDVNPLFGGRAEADFVGLEYFEQIAQDELVSDATFNTADLLNRRVLVVMLAAPLIGLLAGLGPRPVRLIVRLLLVLMGVLATPFALAMIYRAYVDPIVGAVNSERPTLVDPDTASAALAQLDTIVAGSLAIALGATVFMAIMRGRKIGRSLALTIGVFWLAGIVVATASFPQTFDLTQLLTRGGPGFSTMTLSLLTYQQGFEMFNVGYAQALSVLQMQALAACAVVLWALLTFSRARIVIAAEPERASAQVAGASIFGLGFAVLALVPLGLLLFWGVTFSLPAGFPESTGGFDLNAGYIRTVTNTLVSPALVIWLVQIPLMYLLGLALGYLRPLGRIGSDILFLGFIMLWIMPPEVLGFSWFTQLQDLDLLDRPEAIGLPVKVGGLLSLVVFKLFFDGAREMVDRDPFANFSRVVLVPSLGLAAAIGLALMMLSMNDLYWPQTVVRSTENLTLSVDLMRLSSTMQMQWPELINRAMAAIFIKGLLFVPLLFAVQFWPIDRLAILTWTRRKPTDDDRPPGYEPLVEEM